MIFHILCANDFLPLFKAVEEEEEAMLDAMLEPQPSQGTFTFKKVPKNHITHYT